MLIRNTDYSEYDEIETYEIEICDCENNYEIEKKELVEYLKKQQNSNVYSLNKVPRRINQYIDLKILLNTQLSPKIKLWKKLNFDNNETLKSDIYLNNLFAVKIYSKHQLMRKNIVYTPNGKIKTQLHRVINEIKVLQYLSKQDPNKYYITKLHKVLESDFRLINNGKLYLIFNFYPLGPTMIPCSRSNANSTGSTVSFEKNKLTYIPNPKLMIEEKTIKHFVYCTATALLKLHNLNIVHRDVKPDNLLLTESGDVILNDFNSSEFLKENKYVSGTEGTYAFFPPEYCEINFENNLNNFDDSNSQEMELSNEGHIRKQLGRPADMWALGVTIWCWMYKVLPFQGNSILELFENIVECNLEFPVTPAFSNEGIQVLKSLLDPNPDTRWTARQVLDSEWIKDHLKYR